MRSMLRCFPFVLRDSYSPYAVRVDDWTESIRLERSTEAATVPHTHNCLEA